MPTNKEILEQYLDRNCKSFDDAHDSKKRILVDYEDHIRVLLTRSATTCMYRGLVFENLELVEATKKHLYWPPLKEGEIDDEVDPTYALTEERPKKETPIVYIEVRDDGPNPTPVDIKPIIAPILRTQVTEVEEIIKRLDVRSLVVDFDQEAEVQFSNGNVKFVTRWGEEDEPKVIQMALEILRDPRTIWEHNRTSCTDPEDNLFVLNIKRAQVNKLINKICEERNMTLPIEFVQGRVKAIIKLDYQRVFFDGHLRRREDDPFIYYLFLKMLEDTDKYDAHIAEMARAIEAEHLSVATYQFRNKTEKKEVLTYLKAYNHRSAFTVKGMTITVQHEQWEQRDQFEKDLNHIHEVFTDDVLGAIHGPPQNQALRDYFEKNHFIGDYRGDHFTDVVLGGKDIRAPLRAPLKNEALRVYFPTFRRFYYFFTHYQGRYSRVFISGEPSHYTCAVECLIDSYERVLTIQYFFKHETDRKVIKSIDFEGYGPRGMLLVKYIATRYNIPLVALTDAWKDRKGGITSKELKEIMKCEKKGEHHHLYLDNKKAIDKWYKFYVEHNVLDKVIQHGYYGAFGFKPKQDDVMMAETGRIVCATYMGA
jgi:hypothetical protein